MPSNIWIISNPNGTITNFYLSGSGGQRYNGTGTPWTAQATTPIRIAMNDVTGPRWTPGRAPTLPIYGGGPPFTSGRTLISRTYDNVQDVLPIQIYATSHNNAVRVARDLKQVLNLATYSVPTILAVQPDGATNVVYFNILTGDIDENPLFINEEAGRGIYRAVMTLTRSYVGGRLSTGETQFTGQSFANNGTGTPDNFSPYGSSNGDLLYEGQPLNIAITGPSAPSTHFFLATADERTYTAVGAAITTSATGLGVIVTNQNFSLTRFLVTKQKPRVLLRMANPSSNLEVQVRVYIGTVNGTLYLSQWIPAQGGATGGPANTLLDMGTWIDNLQDIQISSGSYTVQVSARSTNGAATSGTLTAIEFLVYSTFCEVIGNGSLSPAFVTRVQTFREQTNMAVLPHRPVAYTVNGAALQPYAAIRGRPPVYVSASGLWYAQFTTTAYDINPTATATITVTSAPLYRTLIGGG